MIIYDNAKYFIADEGYIFKNMEEPFDEREDFIIYNSDIEYIFQHYEEIPILKEDSRNE